MKLHAPNADGRSAECDRPLASFGSESIALTSYSRQRDKLREELTLAKIEHHIEAVDELACRA